MHIRKLVKAGQASFTVALPKEWIKSNKLEKGASIYIKEISHNELAISTELKDEKIETKEISIDIENKSLGTVHRELTSAYINNYGTINIMGKEVYKHIVELRKILNDFVALEITEQTSSKIVAKDMLDLKEVSIDKSIRRMDIIVRSMFKDLMDPKKDMLDSINFRDSDVNRLYFLLFKIVKSALVNLSVAKVVGVKNNVDSLSLWYFMVNIEGISDNIKEIFSLTLDLEKEDCFNDLQKLCKETETSYLEVMKAYYDDKKLEADLVASKRQHMFETFTDFSEKNNNPKSIRIIENLKEIENHICNIARIVMDK
jgi:phosphate uptake regulator